MMHSTHTRIHCGGREFPLLFSAPSAKIAHFVSECEMSVATHDGQLFVGYINTEVDDTQSTKPILFYCIVVAYVSDSGDFRA